MNLMTNFFNTHSIRFNKLEIKCSAYTRKLLKLQTARSRHPIVFLHEEPVLNLKSTTNLAFKNYIRFPKKSLSAVYIIWAGFCCRFNCDFHEEVHFSRAHTLIIESSWTIVFLPSCIIS